MNDASGNPEAGVHPARPDGLSEREWAFTQIWLDTTNGQRTLKQAGALMNPKAVKPAEVAYRYLRKPAVKAYIDAVREAECMELGITRATIALGLQGILEVTEPANCRRVVATKDGAEDRGIDSQALEVRRKTYSDLSRHLGLDKPVRVEHSGSVRVSGFEDARKQLDALFKRALPAD